VVAVSFFVENIQNVVQVLHNFSGMRRTELSSGRVQEFDFFQ
jgi:hypothetical protein